MSWWYPTAFQSWGHEEVDAMRRVEMSGRYTMGPETEAFEREFAAFHGMKHAVMCNSGSSANLLMIAALFAKEDMPLRRGDVAIVPALAWSTTYAPLVQHGLAMIPVDVDGSWNAGWPAVQRAHETAGHRHMHHPETNGPLRLIVGCSILGNPADMMGLKSIADGGSAYFIEDNCESLGAGYYTGDGEIKRRTGTFGLMNSFSLFWSHQLSAIEGGVITTNSDEMNRLLRMLRAHGWTRDLGEKCTFDGEYDFRVMGYNLRPLEMHAAVAREQLKKLDGFRRHREQNANNFRLWANGLNLTPQIRAGIPSPFGLCFIVKDSETRARLVAALRAASIDCRLPTGGSLRRHAYGARWCHYETPIADTIHECGLFLGNAPFDIGEKIQKAVEIMGSVL